MLKMVYQQPASPDRSHKAALRVNCCRTCLLRTPQQINLTPSFIISSKTSFPSWLIVITFLRSTIRGKPLVEMRTLRHFFSSSSAQGATNSPSRTKRHRRSVLIVVIFSMAGLLEQAQEYGFVHSSVQAACAGSQRNVTSARMVRTAKSANPSFCPRREQRLDCIFSSNFTVQAKSSRPMQDGQ